jgi:hypothetical protein
VPKLLEYSENLILKLRKPLRQSLGKYGAPFQGGHGVVKRARRVANFGPAKLAKIDIASLRALRVSSVYSVET